MSSRPTRIINPMSRLLDPNNIGAPALSSHRQAVAEASKASAVAMAELLKANSETLPHSSLPPSTLSSRQSSLFNKHPQINISEDEEDIPHSDDGGHPSEPSSTTTTTKKPAKKRESKHRKRQVRLSNF